MKRYLRTLSLPVIAGLCLIQSGCGGQSQHATPMPPLTPTQQYTEPEQRYSNPGSLYSASEAADLTPTTAPAGWGTSS